MTRQRLHTTVLVAAGGYNLAWGGWIALRPSDLYQAAAIPVPSHPEIAGVIGMVIALYGILYLHAAAHPEHGWPIAAVGLVGKILGPAAFLWHTTTGAWPPDGLVIVIFNDLIWWVPFALYLHQTWPRYRSASEVPTKNGPLGPNFGSQYARASHGEKRIANEATLRASSDS